MKLATFSSVGLLLSLLLPLTAAHGAREIGFAERYALAADREAALKELIAGTEDYYYYHALYYQTSGRRKEFDDIIGQWAKRYPESAGLKSMRNRQVLLDYEVSPKATLEYLRQELGVEFQHRQETAHAKPDLPTRLDPALIGMPAFLRLAVDDLRASDLSKVTDAGLEYLLANHVKMNPQQLRALLQRLQRPDAPNLMDAIIAELQYPDSRGFGTFPIHRQLLLQQLQQLATRRPTVLESGAFVESWLLRLRPGADVDVESDTAARGAWLEAAWQFVKGLSPSFNSLKAHVLYQRLLLDEKTGQMDEARFLEYIKTPRNAPYLSERYRRDSGAFSHPADLSTDYRRVTACPAIGNDEPLVRRFLLHFLKGAAGRESYAPYLDEQYLKEVFAEAKLTGGVGDAEQWFSLLSPSAVQALRSRVDLDFAATNPAALGPEDAVSVDVFVKNVPELLINIFEINTENYYRTHGEQIGTDLNLDGLIANMRRTERYAEAPVLRVKRSFKLDELPARRGVWVVDLIGNGKSSRALLRKGSLQFVTRPSSAGTALTVLDEKRRPLLKAYASVGGQRYEAGKEGEIIIPFSNKPGSQAVIIGDGAGFTQLEHIELQGENYQLAAGFHVARESLIPGAKAILAIRPTLYVNGSPTDIALLEEATLSIIATNLDGVSSTSHFESLKLSNERETTVEFTVPDRLTGLAFHLAGKLKHLITGEKESLTVSASLEINQQDKTEQTSDLHLSRVGPNYVLQELGRSGEPRAERAIVLKLWRQEFGQPVQTDLKTDASGAAALGPLEGISVLSATNANGLSRTWVLPTDRADVPSTVQVAAGQPIAVPWMEGAAAVAPASVSLLEMRQGVFVRNAFNAESVVVKDGFLILQGLPAGDYSLRYGSDRKEVAIDVTQGAMTSGWLVGEARHLQFRPSAPLQVLLEKRDDTELTFSVGNATGDTRVHVLASRFLPDFDAYADLGNTPGSQPRAATPSQLHTLYVSGRTLGEEYRYVLERRLAKKFPGSMLPRPGLLLNPWMLRETETVSEEAKLGEDFKRTAGGRTAQLGYLNGKNGRASAAGVAGRPAESGSASVDFLATPGLTVFNLKPDKDGKVRVKLADLGDRQYVRVLAVNSASSVVRDLSLPDAGTKVRDLALQSGLDPKAHFTQQNQVTIIEKDAPFTLKDAATAKFQMLGDLGAVFDLLQTLTGESTLADFRFVIEWPGYDAAKKRELYSKNACHELSFFLQRKDPEFFKAVILPYLANKKDKTFLDHYLLGDDLRAYLRPWDYHQLNTVERILLAQRHRDEAAATAREVADRQAKLPPDVEGQMRLFDTALARDEMSGGATGALGIDKETYGSTPKSPPAPMAPAPAAAADPFAAPEPKPAAKAKEMGGFGVGAKRAEMPGHGNVTAVTAPALETLGSLANLGATAGRELQARDNAVRLQLSQQLYRALEPTKEWAENNYNRLPIAAQNAALVTVNGFWKDYALWDGKAGFLSPHVAEASHNFTEIMFALAVLDLPFPKGARPPKAEVKGAALTLTPSERLILMHREIKPAVIDKEAPKLLASQNFYRFGDRYTEANGEKQDKFVTEEFLSGVVYGCQVVVTNPTSSTQKLDLIVQIPQGAIAVKGSKATRSQPLRLEAYRTFTTDYYFYFPRAGDFAHHPVHVSKNEKVVAAAEPFAFHVVDELTKLDTGSWDYVSQFGSSADVLAFLDTHNVHDLNLPRMAWRLKDAAFFQQALALLQKRRAYDETTWSYALMHDAPDAIRDYLLHEDAFIATCGAIQCRLVDIDPIARHAYQHLEYSPLVNARAHRLGAGRSILNESFGKQYEEFLRELCFQAKLRDRDLLALSYYLLLQDRVEEAIAVFAKIDPKNIAEHLQYDYMKAVCTLYQQDVGTARQLATAHAEHPVDRWRAKFQEVLAQIDEMEGKKPADGKADDREQMQNALAAAEPTLDFTVESKEVKLAYHNLKEVTVNYYPMDLEFLFSAAPFVSQDTARFGLIRPNRSERVVLPVGAETHTLTLPREYHSSNVLVEITGGGKTAAHAYYANELNVQISENYGRLQVTHSADKRPLAKVYVKVFAEIGGRPTFYKDGYTDLRGKFDYLSLSTPEIQRATRFSVLVLSEEFGAAVKEVKPPIQ